LEVYLSWFLLSASDFFLRAESAAARILLPRNFLTGLGALLAEARLFDIPLPAGFDKKAKETQIKSLQSVLSQHRKERQMEILREMKRSNRPWPWAWQELLDRLIADCQLTSFGADHDHPADAALPESEWPHEVGRIQNYLNKNSWFRGLDACRKADVAGEIPFEVCLACIRCGGTWYRRGAAHDHSRSFWGLVKRQLQGITEAAVQRNAPQERCGTKTISPLSDALSSTLKSREPSPEAIVAAHDERSRGVRR
jgi:hypothetical protein